MIVKTDCETDGGLHPHDQVGARAGDRPQQGDPPLTPVQQLARPAQTGGKQSQEVVLRIWFSSVSLNNLTGLIFTTLLLGTSALPTSTEDTTECDLMGGGVESFLSNMCFRKPPCM